MKNIYFNSLIIIVLFLLCIKPLKAQSIKSLKVQNNAPVFTSTAVTVVNDNATYSYTVFATDADFDVVTLTAPTLPSWLTFTASNYVSVFAGSPFYTGFTDGTGGTARFYRPYGDVVDALGNVYVADTYNHAIRKITASAVTTTLAGSGIAGFADATGTSAQFNYPYGIALDVSGNLYISEMYKIRKVTSAGVVTTISGQNAAGFADGNINTAYFNVPRGVAVDATGKIYVADTGNNRIRIIDVSSGMVSTLAGSGTAGYNDATGTSAQFNSPYGIAIDALGNIYVADKDNNRIRKITSAGVVTTIAGSGTSGFADGTGASAQFNAPTGITLDASGNIYVTDSGNFKIRKITSTGVVTTIAGTGVGGYANGIGNTAQFRTSYGIALDLSGNIYIADTNSSIIRKIANVNILSGSAVGQVGTHSVVLNANDGNGGSTNQSFTITVADVTAPTVSSLTPLDGATNVAKTTNLTITFSENVQKGTGNILIKDASDNSTAQSIDVTSSAVTISSNVVTINPPLNLVKSENYYIQIPNTAFTDTASNAYAGITDTTSWNFASELNTAPTFTSTAITAVNDNATYSYTITTNDVDGDTVTLTATTLPSWLTLSGNTLSGSASGHVGNHSVVLNASDGVGGSTNQSFTITVSDVTAPTVSSLSPTDNATGVSTTSNLVITFNETVQKGTGNILIKDASDNSTAQTIDVTGSLVTISSNMVTINPSSDLLVNKNYYIQIPNTAFTDTASNAYVGITNTTSWNFATQLQNRAPTFTSIAVTTVNDNQTYTYNITTNDADGDAVTLTATTKPSWLTLSGSTLSGSPSGQVGTHSVVLNASDGNGGSTNQSFTITVTDVTAPTVSSFSPADNATGVTKNSNLVITFNENIQIGTGNILIKDASDNSTVQTIDVASAAVSKSFNQATINPPSDLSRGKSYYIQIPNTAFRDAANNYYVGISNTSGWNFTTKVNTAPTFSSTATTAVNDNATYNYYYTTSDADGDTVTVTATTKPYWLTLFDNVLTGSAAVPAGAYSVVLNADDGNGGSTNQSFTITVTDVTAPTITILSPADNATDISVTSNLDITFSEDIQVGTGNILIKDASDNSTAQSIDVTGGAVSVSTDHVTIVLPSDMLKSKNYYIQIPSTAFKDTGNNFYAGISNTTNWNFATEHPTVSFLSGTGYWSVGSNWDTGTAPTSSDNVIIPSGKTITLNTQNAQSYNFTNNGDFVVNAGKSLTVSGDLVNTGTITVKSDAASSASLIVNGSSTGSITYQRYLTGGITWHLVSAPIGAEDLLSFVNNIGSNLNFNGTDCSLTPYNNAGVLGSTTWIHWTLTDLQTAGSFIPAKGYEILTNASGTVSFTGTVPITDVSIAVTGTTNMWNLIGNPFPSTIAANYNADNVNNFLTLNSGQLDSSFIAMYLWNPITQQYDLINQSSSATYIAPGQAFFVKAKTGGGTVNFAASLRSIGNGGAFQKIATQTTPTIKLIAERNNKFKTTSIKYINGTSLGLDPGYDAGLFGGELINFGIYSKLVQDNGEKYALQVVPDQDYDNIIIPIGIDVDSGSQISFKAEASNLPSAKKVVLEDRLLGIFSEINNTDKFYNLTINQDTHGTGRFYLRTLDNASTLGVDDLNRFKFRVITDYRNNQLRIISSENKEASLCIYDLQGRFIWSKKLNIQSEKYIKIPPISNGVYILNIKTNQGDFSTKIAWY